MLDWITTPEVDRETWRRVLEFANIDFTEQTIAARHGAAVAASTTSNYRKQARQVRVALLQAREYFLAAERATLITSPNHLYYGMVSLASAVMLVLGTGKKSFDYLRRNSENRHHGLLFSVGANAQDAGTTTRLLEKSHVEVAGAGHFLNWHSELPPNERCMGLVRREIGEGLHTKVDAVGMSTFDPTSDLVGQKKSLIELMQHLPDLASDLSRFRLQVVHSRYDHEMLLRRDQTRVHSWRIHGAGSQEALFELLDCFRFAADFHDLISFEHGEETSSCIVGVVVPPKLLRPRLLFSWPDSRFTSDFQSVMYSATIKTHEFVDMYMLAYGLSMLSRYFPDLWISCLDSHCMASKLIEATTLLLQRKAPILTIQLLLGYPLVISTHRPPWFS